MFKKRNIIKRTCAVFLGIGLLATSSFPAYARTYSDIDYIMSGIKINIPQTLKIASPTQNITTTASNYYITGTSNPKYGLTCNGYNVSAVGKQGTFATYVDLDYGVNTYTFAQDDGSTATVKITRSGSGETSTTSSLSKLTPEYKSAFVSGEEITLTCVAPSGSSVTATLMGETYSLQPVAVASNGVPTNYKTVITVPNVSNIKDAGTIKYTMKYNGNTKTYNSGGKVLIYPPNSTIYVQVSEPTTPIHNVHNDINNVMGAVRQGGVDYVVDQTSDKYKLSCGGWIAKNGVEPIPNVKVTNNVDEINFTKTMNGEMITFTGSARPLVISSQTSDSIELKMYHTKGITSLPSGINNSKVIKSYDVVEKSDYTFLTIYLKDKISGHVVEYNDNTISLYIKYQARLSSDPNKPLNGITIAIDPGHGGTDLGATGVTHTLGDSECHITANTAIALKRRLEGLGATVIVATIEPDRKTPYEYRMEPAFFHRADMFMSLHCNSLGGDARKAQGTEIYYYYGRHKPAAESILDNIIAHTGRKRRKTLQSVFRVTYNSLAPAMLIEMGFVSTPMEYDEMNSRQGIFNTVNGIADGIIEYFRQV